MSQLKYLFLENPNPLLVVLACSAVAMLFSGFQRGSRRLLLSGVATLLVAGAVFVTARAVVTDREKVIELTNELVRATCPVDLPRLRGLISNQVVIVGPDDLTWFEAGQIFSRLESLATTNQILNQKVLDVRAYIRDGNLGVSDLEISTTFESQLGTNTVPTRWQLLWSHDADGQWRVIKLVWVSIQNQTPSPGMLGG